MLFVAEPEEDPVIRRRRDQQQRRGAGGKQCQEVQDLLKACEPAEPRREWHCQEEGEQDLDPGLRDPNLLQELDQVAVTALEDRLVAAVAPDLLARGVHLAVVPAERVPVPRRRHPGGARSGATAPRRGPDRPRRPCCWSRSRRLRAAAATAGDGSRRAAAAPGRRACTGSSAPSASARASPVLPETAVRSAGSGREMLRVAPLPRRRAATHSRPRRCGIAPTSPRGNTGADTSCGPPPRP